ncbi:MAG: dipeptide ABC transporter ATP-binding protein [SAR324 cluster bacterium]|nr:dipeptide ABC transporter ATP-binding protein [SAR324 cluster bacterium]
MKKHISKMSPLLKVSHLTKTFNIGNWSFKNKLSIKAVNDVSFNIDKAKTLAIIGESGCGKSTLAKMITGIESPDEGGNIKFKNQDISSLSNQRPLELLKDIQMVFQNPYASLNPRQKISHIVSEPLLIHTKYNKEKRRELSAEMLKKVGLSVDMLNRYPHMFSGGQRQRIAIARAIILKPSLVILDEPVSALDLSVQAQVLNLLQDLKDELQLTYLFISHNMSIVRYFADYLVVMYLGRIVEEGAVDEVLSNPKHPYTRALIAASPSVKRYRDQKKIPPLSGEIPSLLNPPKGCPFVTRCPIKIEKCDQKFPEAVEYTNHKSYCYRSDYQE